MTTDVAPDGTLRSVPPEGARWAYVFGALGGLLFGYDIGVIGGALLFIRQALHLDPMLQGVVVSALLMGAVIGAAACIRLSNPIGPRRLLIGAGVLLAAGSLGAALAPGAVWLIAFRVVIGLGVGVASVQVPIYLSEMAPTRIRGALSTLNQIMISGGIFTAYLVNYALAGSGAWRLMIGLAIIPALLLIAGMSAQPESPRWLYRQGRIAEARAVLLRNRDATEADAELAGMAEATRRPQLGFADLLRTRWLRRPLLLAAGLAILQQVVGINTIIYYAPTIFRAAGFGNASAILITLGLGGLTLVVTICTSQIVDRVGRRPLMLGGALMLSATMAILGAIFFSGALATTAGIVLAVACIALYKTAFSLSWGPLVWVLLPEVLPLQARGPAMGAATLLNWLANFFVALTFPVLLAAGAGTIFEVFACFGLIAFFFARSLLHETSGRSLEQIELEDEPLIAE
ncbi:MAG TPA: sugar porter family MFS transporter [Acetobacteraceae bacterium]|nr:sugar porter family MFS transporter [Acetobacteraceae bacterium]